MELRPDVNDTVVLRTAEGRSHDSRVEGLGGVLLTVARPLDLAPEAGVGPGADLQVGWSSPRGVAVLPARLLEERSEGGLRLWVLVVTGAGWIEQRRDFVRVRVRRRLALRAGETGELVAELVDVSEAALRCSVDAASAALLGAEDPGVVVDFRLGERDFSVPASVSLCRTPHRPGSPVEVVVVFDRPVADAAALRREVFAQQLRAARH